MRWWAASGLVATLLAAGPPAGAQDVHEWILWDPSPEQPEDVEDGPAWGPPPPSFNGTSTVLVEWHADNRNGDPRDDDYGDAISRTQLVLEGGGWYASTRLDGVFFRDAPHDGARRDDLRVERVALGTEQQIGAFRLGVEAGDLYAQLGRGLVLSLRQMDELGVDVALRGAKVELTLPGDAWRMTVLGGVTNSVNLEMQRLHFVEDPVDAVAGARAEGRAGATTIGVHGAGVRAREAGVFGNDHTASFGGGVDTELGDATVGVEIDGQTRRRAGIHDDGWAAYATATLPIGDRVFLLAELKHYASFEAMRGSTSTGDRLPFGYSLPPTAEPEDQELLDNTDITGGRILADVVVPWGDSTADVSLGLFRDRRFDQWFAHAVGSLERRWESGVSAEVAAGYRREWDVATGDLRRAILAIGGDLTVPISGAWSVHGAVRDETHAEAVGQVRHVFHRGTATLEAQSGEDLAVAGGFEWDTQGDVEGVADTFAFGLVRWRASDALTLSGLFGTQRGGVKCLGGVCRTAPPFAGARLDASLRF